MGDAVNTPLPIDLDELIPTRQSLLSRLKNWDDNESWRDFFHTYWKLIYAAARRSGLTDVQAQDVVQETIIQVCRQMPDFRYDPVRGSFKAWLLNITSWRIIDHVRARQREARLVVQSGDGPDGMPMIDQMPDTVDPELGRVWDEEWERNLYSAALQRVKTKVKPKHYQIFDLHVLKEWPSERVCRTLEVNVAQVYLAKHRITALIKKEVKVLETRFSSKS